MKRSLFYCCLTVFATLTFSACLKEQRPQAEVDLEIINKYIEDNNLNVIEHPSGIFYAIEEPGTGEHPPFESDVEVKYKGYLTDGTVFDQSKPNETVTFALENLIPGWQIAIPLLKPGGKGLFILPSRWAYGPTGVGSIPPNSVLIFEIELVSFQ